MAVGTVEQVKKRAKKKASVFAEVFRNPQGAEVLRELKKQFDPEWIVCDNAHETTIRAAQRDVVRWIEEVIDRGNRDVEG